MRRLTSVFTHVLPAVAIVGLLVATPAMAQSTPPLARAVMPVPAPAPDHLQTPQRRPGVAPAATRPTPTPGQGRQPGQGQQGAQGQQGQAMVPPSVTPRAASAPNIGGP